ncbi:MAG: family 10 glycosylhydrolase, partial [Chlorobi bacterium]|nr:family 10 glycosylhydrolase [Chlorobiota bacterium]
WLTGKQGKAPEPYYDPLKFMIKECKKRNIEFHAWINPFRAVATIDRADIAENHITKRKPEWFFTYGINKYFDPGIPEVRKYVTEIIKDIVRRYDINGIHFDDYFYPYPEKNDYKKIIPVPDKETFEKYNSGFDNIEDWRRNNMDLFIKDVYDAVKTEKPEVKFGISPSGVWRNKSQDPEGSDTRGLAHYDYLYSDLLKWLKNGWIDYVAPQLYWVRGNKYADYETLVKWWSNHTYGKQLYIGQAVYNAGENANSYAWRNPNELPEQIKINRKNPEVLGSIFYRASSLRANPLGFCDSLQYHYYKIKVSPPDIPAIQCDTDIIAEKNEKTNSASPYAPNDIIATPLGNKVMISWKDENISKNNYYTVYKFRNYDFKFADEKDVYKKTDKTYIILKRKLLPFLRKKYTIVITAVNSNGQESPGSKIIYVKL